MKDRYDIKHFILSIENQFPVNSWKANGIHVWPLIRIVLFTSLAKSIRSNINTMPVNLSPNTKPKPSILLRIKFKLKSLFCTTADYFSYLILNRTFKRWKQSLSQKEYIFAGSNNHRVLWNGAYVNRFFDSFIEMHNLESSYYFIEYGISKLDKLHNSKSILERARGLHLFNLEQKLYSLLGSKEKYKIEIDGYTEFIMHLKNHSAALDFTNKYKINYLIKVLHKWINLFQFYSELFNTIKPKQLHVLCYYNFEVMAMLAAANQLKLKTVELQHGSIGDLHLAYSNYDVVPDSGYMMLPQSFRVWDNNTESIINKWTKNNPFHSVVVVGHPWIDYCKTISFTQEMDSDFILYALQPSLDLKEQLFNGKIIETIKKGMLLWYLRVHPRQLDQKEIILNYLREKSILHLVEIEKATNYPLPLLIANAKLIITHSSGCAIEAAIMNKKSIIINEVGLNYYQNLIDDGTAFYLEYNDPSFYESFMNIIQADLS